MSRTYVARSVAVAAILALFAGRASAAPLGTEFTYQAEVVNAGVLAAGPVDLRFRVYDAAVGGARVDAIGPFGVERAATALVNGRFTTTLDFGAAVYSGDARWLEIDVRAAGGGAYTTLVPRQLLSAAPYARFAPNATNAVNATNATNAVNATNATNATNAATATNALNLGGNPPAFYTNASNITSGTLADARLSANVALLNLAQTFSAAKSFTATAAFNNANPFTVTSTNLITNLNADLLDGQTGAFYQNASNITLGTIGDARLSANVALRNATNNFSTFNTFDGGTNATLTSGTGDIQVGPNGSPNLGIDENEIQGRNGAGGPSQLYLNNQGGNVYIGNIGTSLVGIGTSSPERFFHVFGGSAGTVTSNAGSLAVFENDANAYISLLTPAANESGILFGTPTNAQEGGIIYGNSAVGNGMQFRTNGNVTRMTLTSVGDLIINDDTSSIQFPATVSPNDAMIHMFASGTGNATRTVIGHSPGFDEWGLTYNDGTDTFIFSQTIGGDPTLAIDMNAGPGFTTGHVGIGTLTPSTKLNIVGGTDASLTAGTGSVQIGLGTTFNLAIDSNEVQVRNGAGGAASLFLNAQGGNVFVGSAGTSLVGIGTAGPERLLHVFGGSAGAVTSNANALAVFEDNVNGYINLLTPATLESGVLFGNPGNAQDGGIIYVGSIDEMQFRTNGNVTRMVLQGDGRVGIGDTSPDAGIDVTTANSQVGEFDRQGTDGTIIEFQNDGVVAGSITVTGAIVSYNAFTGSHFGWTDDRTIQLGELVSFTGVNKNYHGDPSAEPFYGIQRTAKANDPATLGAYLGLLEPSRPIDLKNPDQIMAVGNAVMWIVDTGANLEPGDYLISSDVPGCAMKDDSTKYPIGHVVAKAAERVDWTKVEPGTDGVRRAKISVLLGSFARTTAATLPQDQLATLIVLQQQQIQELEGRLKALESSR
jgi:hypothetical protein